MSYILDALRRADSERERGAVPSLHAQPEPLLPDEEAAPPRVSPRTWVAGALGVILVLGLALVWALTRPDEAPARGVSPAPGQPPLRAGAPPLATIPAPVQATAAPSLPPLPPEALLPPAAAALPKTPPRTGPGAVATREASAPAQAGAAMAPESGPRALPATAAARRAAVAASAARESAGGAGAEAAAPPRVYAQHELPEEIRRGLPALVVNGSVFSKNAADRFLIINGQIVHEKDTVAPDVVLEQIKLRAAVLSSKGYRFEITY